MRNANWMLLGRTGCGKSSLINYIFGKECAKTGAGKPVQKQGEWQKITIPLGNKQYTFYDSWGLEADKDELWKKEIVDKLNSASIGDYDNAFLGVIYCLSYGEAIACHDFEADILKTIMHEGYHIVIAFTKCDDRDYVEKRIKYQEKLARDLGHANADKYTVCDICSVIEEKLGGDKAEPFGKEGLLKQIAQKGDENFKKITINRVEKWRSKAKNDLQDLETIIQGNYDIKMRYVHMAQSIRKVTEDNLKKISNDIAEGFKWYESVGEYANFAKKADAFRNSWVMRQLSKITEAIADYKFSDDLQRDLREMLKKAQENIDECADSIIKTMGGTEILPALR